MERAHGTFARRKSTVRKPSMRFAHRANKFENRAVKVAIEQSLGGEI